ncbi:MAG: HAMP domain-containing histidine kinase [Planctomycetes bacterium]|nr:HAMP domain-containing histidine kinase [Planctomycetota bacterium]
MRRTKESRSRLSNPPFELVIRDHGPGVPDGVKERVFERFYQHVNTLTAKPPGTGLGLTIARTIASHHGHTIRCSDADGCGARFTLAGPLANPPTAPAAAATPPAAPAAATTPASA